MSISKVKILLFDMDNTLIDRNNAMEQFIRHWLLSTTNLREEAQEAEVQTILGQDNWGYMGRLEFCSWLLKRYDLLHDLSEEEQKLKTELFMSNMLRSIPGYLKPPGEVISILAALKKKYRLLLATNGASETQRMKIGRSGLEEVFDKEDIYVSGEVGYDKPDKRYYQRILDDVKHPPQELMMVGDDPLNDIHGAALCGIQTCWVAHGRTYPQELIAPAKTIQTIREIEIWTNLSI